MSRRTRRNPHLGSSVESFLEEEGILHSSTIKATKAVIAWQIAQEMQKAKITKTAMAKRLKTSRAQLNRLLDPSYDNTTLATLDRIAGVLGRRVVIELR